MVSWGVVIPEGLIIRKLGYAGIIYSFLHPPLCIQRIVIFLFFKKCVSQGGVHTHVGAGAHWVQKWVSGPLVLELQAIKSHLIWVPGD